MQLIINGDGACDRSVNNATNGNYGNGSRRK